MLRGSYTPVASGKTEARPDPALRGVQAKNCNREACQKPGAFFYNMGTMKYYCFDCAKAIDAWDDQKELFPDLQKIFEARWSQGPRKQVPRPVSARFLVNNSYSDEEIQQLLDMNAGESLTVHDELFRDPRHTITRLS